MATPGHGGATSSDIAQALNTIAGSLSSHYSVAIPVQGQNLPNPLPLSLSPGTPSGSSIR